jgi:hypothetical protein
MILDYQLMFDATTTSPVAGISIATAGLTTQISTNTIDLGLNRDLGIGGGNMAVPKIMAIVTTKFTSTNASATLNVKVQGSTDGTTYQVYAETGDIQCSYLTAGTKILNIDLPGPFASPQSGTYATSSSNFGLPRYLRLAYYASLSTFSAGSILAGISLGHDEYNVMPPGVTVTN